MTRKLTPFLYAAALMAAPTLQAATVESLAGEITSCAKIESDAARLSCFDEAARSLGVDSAAEQASAAASVAVATDVATDTPDVIDDLQDTEATSPAADPVNGAVVAAAAPVAEVSDEQDQQNAVDEFGMTSELASKMPDREPAEPLREIKATVVEVRKRVYGEHVVTLDNGQVWSELRNENGLRIKVGDTVRIKKGSMGGYRIVGGGNRSSSVKRIE